MKKIPMLIIACALLHVPAAFAAFCAERDCDYDEELGACGANASGYFCMVDSSCIVKCLCDNSNEQFVYNVGCVCKSGTYGSNCTACPSSGSSAAGSDAITDCYKRLDKYIASAHGTLNVACYYSTGTGGYTNCQSSGSVVSCDAGYYRASTSSTTCTAVGTNYYSISPLSRAICPTYRNNAGTAVNGITTGSGTGADAITDCMIPRTETFANTKGKYTYNTCYYSN